MSYATEWATQLGGLYGWAIWVGYMSGLRSWMGYTRAKQLSGLGFLSVSFDICGFWYLWVLISVGFDICEFWYLWLFHLWALICEVWFVWAIYMSEWATQLDGLYIWVGRLRSCVIGFFDWVECGRLSRLGWMGTAFSNGLNGNGFFGWVEWERLFQMGWMWPAFSNGLNGNGFFGWVGLFQMG